MQGMLSSCKDTRGQYGSGWANPRVLPVSADQSAKISLRCLQKPASLWGGLLGRLWAGTVCERRLLGPGLEPSVAEPLPLLWQTSSDRQGGVSDAA